MIRILGLAAAAVVLLVSPGAWAVQVTHTFCFEYLTNYTDDGTGEPLDGTAGTFGTGIPAIGAKLRLTRNSNGDVFDFTLNSSGCKTINLEAQAWTVALLRSAIVVGHTLEVRSDATGNLYQGIASTSFTPTDGGTTNWQQGTDDVVNIMAAATYALWNEPALTPTTFSFRNGLSNCSAGAAGCWDLDTQTINIGVGQDALAKYKFGILHELGHAITNAAIGYAEFASDCNAIRNDCPGNGAQDGHSMPSKEYSSCAVKEGIAHFYSALVLNPDHAAGADCEIEKHYDPDWNHDLDGGGDDGEDRIFSCEAGDATTNPDLPGNDYFGATCTAGVLNNRSTEYDWLRMYWDLTTDHAIDWPTILEQWEWAGPDNWLEDGDGTGLNYPGYVDHGGALDGRLSNAALVLGFQADYDAAAAWNGTDR